MAYKLNISKDVHNDIDSIVTYISHELKGLQAADSFLDDIEKSYRNIVDNPFMYALCNDELLHRKEYRKITIKNYLIFYRIDEPTKTVFVVRIIYSARDYANLL